MGRRTKKEKAKKIRVKSRGLWNTGLSSLNREANTFPIYLPLKSCLFCHHLVKLLYLFVISLEELQEAGLRAGGAFHSTEAQVLSDTLQVPEIHAKILNPQTATFPNRGQLSRPANHPKRTQGSLTPRTYFLKASLLPLIITVTSGKN